METTGATENGHEAAPEGESPASTVTGAAAGAGGGNAAPPAGNQNGTEGDQINTSKNEEDAGGSTAWRNDMTCSSGSRSYSLATCLCIINSYRMTVIWGRGRTGCRQEGVRSGALGWSWIFAHTGTRLPFNAIQPCLFPLLGLQLLQEGGLDATPHLRKPFVSSALCVLTLSRPVRPRGWARKGPAQEVLTPFLTFPDWALNCLCLIPSPWKAGRQPKCMRNSPLSPERGWNIPTLSQVGGPPGPSKGQACPETAPGAGLGSGLPRSGDCTGELRPSFPRNCVMADRETGASGGKALPAP
ncbi:uncharacterized protein LOC130680390 isoform X2 [Manis pentadactyla]|nr:uncharacterized protein LOC130680390 isoform X2 [Manis pentadactyla]